MTKAAATEHSINKQMLKHMGCMAGFRQLFERHHIAGAAATKCLYYGDSLPSSPATETTTPSESEKSVPPSPPPKSPLTIAGAAKATWMSGKDAPPRLSLDSRAVTDSKGRLRPKDIRTPTNSDVAAPTDETQHHRSPSVVARLMGLELPPPPSTTASEPELRRSSSESRASKDLFYSRFEDFSRSSRDADPWAASDLKCFFDSRDAFAEPRKKASSRYGEIENKLRMSQDTETLSQILEALRLKGLLRYSGQIKRRNFVYADESPPVSAKPSKSAACPPPINRRIGIDCSQPKSTKSPKSRRSYGFSGEISPAVSPRKERSSSSVKPKPSSAERKRSTDEIAENRRVSPVHSPKVYSRQTGPDQTRGSNRLPMGKRPTAEIRRKEKTATITITTIVEDESYSVSDNSYSTSTDTERSKSEERKDGTNLLEGSGKLLHSTTEMASTDMQPSPVSVLDYKDEPFTPSPVTTRRRIGLKDHVEDDPWSPLISPIQSKFDYEEDEEASRDSDLTYISDILRASHYLPQNPNLFSLLEEQRYPKAIDSSKVLRLRRKLTFDVVREIVDRNERLPPWKNISLSNSETVYKIWLEFIKLRDRCSNSVEDLFGAVCGVLKEDLGGDALNGWGDCCVEVSDSILDVERMIFRDLVSEVIRDFAAFSSRRSTAASSSRKKITARKKLVF